MKRTLCIILALSFFVSAQSFENTSALDFEQTNSQFLLGSAPLNFGTADFVVSLWLKNETNSYIASNRSGSGNEWYIINGVNLEFRATVSSVIKVRLAANLTNVPADGEWHHVWFYCDRDNSTNNLIAIDGESVAFIANSSSTDDIDIAGTFYISRYVSSYGDHIADEIAIFKGAGLGGIENAQEAYNNGLVLDMTTHSSAAQLTDYWRLEEGSGQAAASTVGSITFQLGVTGSPGSDDPTWVNDAPIAPPVVSSEMPELGFPQYPENAKF